MILSRTAVTGFVVGVIVAVFVMHAYSVYTMRAAVIQNSQSIAQIVQFINGTQGQRAPQIAPTTETPGQ